MDGGLAWGASTTVVEAHGVRRGIAPHATGSLGSIDPRAPYRPAYAYPSSGPAFVYRGPADGTPLPLATAVAPPRAPATASSLLDALSVNKSQLADILGITRPTLYEWLAGKEPSPDKAARIEAIARVLATAGARAGRPLNAAFVRRALPDESASLLDVLRADVIDEARAVGLVRAVVALDAAQAKEREDKERSLRSRGFEPVDASRSRDILADNLASASWQKP